MANPEDETPDFEQLKPPDDFDLNLSDDEMLAGEPGETDLAAEETRPEEPSELPVDFEDAESAQPAEGEEQTVETIPAEPLEETEGQAEEEEGEAEGEAEEEAEEEVEEEEAKPPSKVPLIVEGVLVAAFCVAVLGGAYFSVFGSDGLFYWAMLSIYILALGFIPYVLWKTRATCTLYRVMLAFSLAAILTAAFCLLRELKTYDYDIKAAGAKQRVRAAPAFSSVRR